MKRPQDTKNRKLAGITINLCLVAVFSLTGCGKQRTPSLAPSVEAAPLDPLKEAVRLVEEDRGEPMGRKAEVNIPSELRHYSDRRRFLAVQTAAWRETSYTLPHDFAELIELIEQGELVEVQPLGPEYVLYGAGENATDEPFTHFDHASGQSIPVCATDDDFKKEDDRLGAAIADLQAKLAALSRELKASARRDRSTRKILAAQIVETRVSIAAEGKRRKVLESVSRDPEQRALLKAECRKIERLAASFGNQSYDLSDAAARRQLKIRLLSFLRRDARDVMLEIARAYKQKFNRPLAITSLVRTEEYQRLLSESNRNAARNSAPPHTTGLAFDVYYAFMNSAEQDYLMSVIAEMKDTGRIEALRETRDHIHVFAFAAGRPKEKYVTQAIAHSSTSKIKRPNAKKERIDKLLVERGMVESRARAQALILAGQVLVAEQRIDKPGQMVDSQSEIRIKGEVSRYVSRGGLKLEAALREFNIIVEGKTCLDVGASTGGFTDCLLQHGAARVWAVDVGHNQLAWRIRQDPRVEVIEGLNARTLDPNQFPMPFDLATVDVSFISLTKILPAVAPRLAGGADCIALIKPQFEVGKGEVGKGGIVTDPIKHQKVLREILDAAEACELPAAGLIESPILGAEGNREFLMHLKLRGERERRAQVERLIVELTA